MIILRNLFPIFILLLLSFSLTYSQPLPKDERLEWWREAKFGMFVHWGVYAIPAGEWKGEKYGGISEWIMAHADIPIPDYEKLPPQFNPVKYNPAEWVKAAKNAGMKYIVITSKHHDGFSIYDSKVSDYNIVDATPYGKDVLKSLSEECKKAGIKFCIYYSILDWHHPSQETDRDVEFSSWTTYGKNKMIEDKKAEYISYMKGQLKEVIENYDPEIIWFDGGWTEWWTPEDGKDLMDYLWNLNPGVIINNRAAGTIEMEQVLGDYLTPEQLVPKGSEQKDWETCMTMNDSWGYKRHDNNWKSTETLIHNLVDIASKGGNFLLNVGPSDEGIIPDESIKRLSEIGEWMNINGEAIYGTTNWEVWKEGDNELITDYYEDDIDRKVEFTDDDFRFTTKDNVIYASMFIWPEDDIIIKSINSDNIHEDVVKSVSLLGSDHNISWSYEGDGLSLSLPETAPCKYTYVFKIELDK
jgi:alpha-L-fucosidase